MTGVKGRRQRQLLRGHGEAGENEIARLADRERPVLLAQGVVEEAGEHVALLGRRSQTLVKAVLYCGVDHPVDAGDQHLGRHRDGARIGDDPLPRLVELKQDVDRDRAGDQRVGVIRSDPFRVVR